MDKHVIREDHPAYPPHLIRPEHINTSKHFWNTFGAMETETSANWIVRLCQKLDGWKTFSEEQIQQLYRGSFPNGRFTFNRLLQDDHVITVDRGQYAVTHDFICRCFMAAPADDLFVSQKPPI